MWRIRGVLALGVVLLLTSCGAPIQPTTLTPANPTVTLPAPQGSLGDYYSLDIQPSSGCAPTQVYLDQGNGLGESQINISSDYQYNPPPGQEVTIQTPLGDWEGQTPQALQVTFSLGGQGCSDDNWGSITLTWDGPDA